MGTVTVLECDTSLDIPADRVLEAAVGKLMNVLVAGYTEDGDEWFASSTSDVQEVIWLLERFKLKLLRDADRDADS